MCNTEVWKWSIPKNWLTTNPNYVEFWLPKPLCCVQRWSNRSSSINVSLHLRHILKSSSGWSFTTLSTKSIRCDHKKWVQNSEQLIRNVQHTCFWSLINCQKCIQDHCIDHMTSFKLQKNCLRWFCKHNINETVWEHKTRLVRMMMEKTSMNAPSTFVNTADGESERETHNDWQCQCEATPWILSKYFSQALQLLWRDRSVWGIFKTKSSFLEMRG